jgi:hypothetical protein
MNHRVRYERRNGQWVEKDTSVPLPSINDRLTQCDHEWGPYNGPIPAVWTKVPYFYYVCKKCKETTTTHVQLIKFQPFPNCEHDYQNDPKLGKTYEKYQACKRCGDQKKIE